jgi:hypothetical protein
MCLADGQIPKSRCGVLYLRQFDHSNRKHTMVRLRTAFVLVALVSVTGCAPNPNAVARNMHSKVAEHFREYGTFPSTIAPDLPPSRDRLDYRVPRGVTAEIVQGDYTRFVAVVSGSRTRCRLEVGRGDSTVLPKCEEHR